MRIEIFYEAPSEVIELSEEEADLWERYTEAKDDALGVKFEKGWQEAMPLYNKADRLFQEFYELVEGKFSYDDLEVEEITEW